jgi:hypothetical protein
VKGERFTELGRQRDMKKTGTELSKYSPVLDLFSAVSIHGVDWSRGTRAALFNARSAGWLLSCLICRFLCPNCHGDAAAARLKLAAE